jgi:hypothetical protein
MHGNAALRRELIALGTVDQAAREAFRAGCDEEEVWARIEAVDQKTTARMKEVVAAHGWPGKTLVGKDGAQAAWLLVQHADRDVAFQRMCLGLMEQAMRDGEAEPASYAYLVDRVAVNEGRKQTYGTQFAALDTPRPIEDEANVDERRKAVGLDSLESYRRQMAEVFAR